MKQSSIDWYYEQTVVQGKMNYAELFEQAKAMHKQEYIDAWMNGQNDSGYSQKELRQMAEADYNETFRE